MPTAARLAREIRPRASTSRTASDMPEKTRSNSASLSCRRRRSLSSCSWTSASWAIVWVRRRSVRYELVTVGV